MAASMDFTKQSNIPNISFNPPPGDQAVGGIILTEEERRTELKQLLSSTIPCLMIGVEEAESDITSIFNLDYLTEKRSSCQLLIGLSKILKEYPKGMGYIPRPLPSALSQLPKLREFRAQMDLLIWEIISKLSILKEFVLASNTDLQKLFVVALSIRDAKNCFTQNQCEHYIRAMDEVDPNIHRKLFSSPKPQRPVLSKAPKEIMDSTNNLVDNAIQNKSISSSDKVSVFREMISQRAFQMKEDPIGFRNELLEKRRTRLITHSDDGASGRDGELGVGKQHHHGGSKRNSIGNGSPLIHSGSYDTPKSPEALHSGSRTPVEKLKSHFLTPGKSRSFSDPPMAGEQSVSNPSVERVNRFYKLHHSSASPSASAVNIPTAITPPVLNLSSGNLGSMLEDHSSEWEKYDQAHATAAGCGHLQDIREFKTDTGRATLSILGDLDNFTIKEAHNDDMFFREDFLQRNHINFLGVSKTADKTPVAVSVCHYLLESGVDTELLYIIRTQEADERLRFTLTRTKDCSAKDMIKMLKKARPQFLNFKIKEVRDEALMNQLLDFEAKNTLQCKFKFGVLYCREGQTEENDLYGNNHEAASRDYTDFLDVLGERVPLKGWTAYRGGLDIKEDLTGTHSVFRKWRNYEIMYHVATMIPPKPDDAQQVDRKRHLGNDIVVIIFKEGDTPISPAIFKSNFNHIFAVVQVDKQHSTPGDTHYHLSVASKDEITSFGPQFPKYYSFSKDELSEFLVAKLINGERWVLSSPVFAHKIVRSRREFLQSYTNDFLDS